MGLGRSNALTPYLGASTALLRKVDVDRFLGHPSGRRQQQQQLIRLYRSSSQYNNIQPSNGGKPSGHWWSKVLGVSAAGYAVMKLKGLKILIPATRPPSSWPIGRRLNRFIIYPKWDKAKASCEPVAAP
mmetsp:Transcript_17118/g.16964  ORF Transcript_17118/g.16964 Transcript_17118/m.16964 type:complete len:129 (-) Transcript_17118:197-583(-)